MLIIIMQCLPLFLSSSNQYHPTRHPPSHLVGCDPLCSCSSTIVSLGLIQRIQFNIIRFRAWTKKNLLCCCMPFQMEFARIFHSFTVTFYVCACVCVCFEDFSIVSSFWNFSRSLFVFFAIRTQRNEWVRAWISEIITKTPRKENHFMVHF